MAEPTGGVDWQQVVTMGGAAGVFLGGLFAALFRRGKPEEVDSATPRIIDTKIVTADSVAMNALASSVEANTVVMAENNALNRDLLTALQKIAGDVGRVLDEQRQTREREKITDEVLDRLREEQQDRRSHPRGAAREG